MSAELFDRLKQELESLDEAANLTMTAVFMLPKALTKLLSWIIRNKRVHLSQLAEYFEQSEEVVRPIVESLVEKKFIESNDEMGATYYTVNLGTPKSRPSPPPRKTSIPGLDE